MLSENATLVSLIKNISATKENAQNVTQEGCPGGDSTVETVIKALAYFFIFIVSWKYLSYPGYSKEQAAAKIDQLLCF